MKEINGKNFYEDSKGRLVPEESMKEIDLYRDTLIDFSFGEVEKLLKAMSEAKKAINSCIRAFLGDASKVYKVKSKGEKGNMSFTSFDGKRKVVIAQNYTVTLNEGVYAAKQLIDEFLTDVTSDASADLKELINSAFRVKNGNLNTDAVLKLVYFDIKDSRWRKAINIINQSKVVTPSAPSLRFYEKNAQGKFEMINLDFSTTVV